MDYRKDILEYIELEREVLSRLDVDALNEAMGLIEEAYKARKKVYIFGNGGSSATAAHYQNDFNKGLSETLDTKFEFVCLNNDTATLMAIANDIGFEEVFRYQLKGRIREGSLLRRFRAHHLRGRAFRADDPHQHLGRQGCLRSQGQGTGQELCGELQEVHPYE